ncbi:MFS general substrate transporter [Rhizopogon vinicolor AM-OR11-026]|uniref:MFS general substrate transporter n=1 Tax=Rhizopogon vinicolor AM-OR11-026 TaxID=1314800 RepID=A0A1B7N010_9AGAM|nr:MFS general substrate transporter [Rhizopogon vinicolor AM-OR11-026]
MEKGSIDARSLVLEEKQFIEELNLTERAGIFRKIDWHLLPFVAPRNANIAGMSTDLNLIGFRYNIAAAVNIVLKLFRPSRWIPTIMVMWGIVMTLMCLVNSFESLVIARMCLGLAGAGLFPGVNYYICRWYPRSERSKRISIFFSAAIIAGAFSGFLAYAIDNMEGIGGLHGWQWIFCLEGLATIVVACLSVFFIHDSPETATFLTEPEREYIMDVLKLDANHLSTDYSIQFISQAMKDYKLYIQVLIYMGLLVPGYAITLFLPTIINELGYSSTNAQLLSVTPYVASCLAAIIVGIYSDKYNLRGPYIIGGASVSLVGFILLYCSSRPGPSYIGVCLAATGTYAPVAVIIAWVGSNAGGDVRRGVALAMVMGLGTFEGTVCSCFIYVDPPRFHIGHGTIMGFLSLAISTTLFTMWNFNRLNKKKEAQCQAEGITEDRSSEFTNMGDDSPLFR